MKPYITLFIKNGYDSMKAIQSIQSKQELQEIGVMILGHRSLMMNEIKKLQLNKDENHEITKGMETNGMVIYESDGLSGCTSPSTHSTATTDFMFKQQFDQNVNNNNVQMVYGHNQNNQFPIHKNYGYQHGNHMI